MRSILFRGKDIRNNWHIGLLVHKGNAWYISTETGIPTAFEVIPNTIGQYIGLKDEDGNMIFEGDIVDTTKSPNIGYWENYDDYAAVEWDDDICGFKPFANYDVVCNIYIDASICKVIGNIYDNPELLK